MYNYTQKGDSGQGHLRARLASAALRRRLCCLIGRRGRLSRHPSATPVAFATELCYIPWGLGFDSPQHVENCDE
jgi:hypothetical protein